MNIVVGITGGIAAFKTAQLVSDLKKEGHNIDVIMSENATKFISPLTFETLTNNRVSIDTFDRNFSYDVHHISIAKKADVFVIVPCSANVIAKVAHGLADDMLTTTFLASNCPKIICPAMNTNMLNNKITQDNIKKCIEYGIKIVESDSGILACGDIGDGKLASIEKIKEEIYMTFYKKTLTGKKVLVSAGATIEEIDPIRYITNHSSGKMGYATAKAFRNLGAEVTLVTGKTNLNPVYKTNIIQVTSAKDMENAILQIKDDFDIIIMASAVADYTVKEKAKNKIKKSGDISLELVRTTDILKEIGKNKKENQILIGFAMESENLLENAKEKLINKNCDYIIANNVNQVGAGFNVDTNIVSIISREKVEQLEIMSKLDIGYKIAELCNGGVKQ
ncbi:MAG: bifunctional phosphopantothenoylcysteine decarboxylase/phosphopantothenate--cysteine ligase CoaBC [Erysipelotrichaceae bacterium]|nr:bifunctional phosphopantothenoylcysteine decarboxylase/phosphopantothenate--cysteine ligase CoaBC [Erysipelotrichaceae bacterium]